MYTIPFQTFDWSVAEKSVHPGETGTAWWRTIRLGGLRLRMVEYSAGYVADHWCRKGHVLYCLEGELITELEDGTRSTLATGMMYVVSDELSSHRSTTVAGAKLLIVDGDFLQTPKP